MLALGMGAAPSPEFEASELVLATLDKLEAENSTSGGQFEGGVNTSMAAAAGHSAGGRAAFAFTDGPEIDAMIGYATFSMSIGVSSGKPVLLLVGAEDTGVQSIEAAYDELTPVKRFVSIGAAGHNSFTDQCAILHSGNNFLEILIEGGFPIPENLADLALDGCRPENLSPAEFQRIAQHFTVAHLRSAFGIDDPPVGLGAGIANTFDGIEILYHSEQ